MQVWLGLVSDNCKETEIKFPIKKLPTTSIDIIAYNGQGNYVNPSPCKAQYEKHAVRDRGNIKSPPWPSQILSS